MVSFIVSTIKTSIAHGPKMLTIDQVNRIYREGFDIHLKRNSLRGLKGEIDPAALEILIYLANAESEYDRDITLLHELIHAREEIGPMDSSLECHHSDEEAIRTYEQSPHVLEYVKDLYDLG